MSNPKLNPTHPKTQEGKERIRLIIKTIPKIKRRFIKGGQWNAIKDLCEPLGLTDTSFREHPIIDDYLLDIKYWKKRLSDSSLKENHPTKTKSWEKDILGKFIGFNDRGIVYYSDGLAVTGYTTPMATCRNCGATAKGEKAKEWQFGHINCPKPNGYFLRNDFTVQDLIDTVSQVRTQAYEEGEKAGGVSPEKGQRGRLTRSVSPTDTPKREDWKEMLDNETWARDGDRVVISRDRLETFISQVRTQAIEEERERVVEEMPKPIEDVFDKRVSEYGCPTREWLYGYNQAIDDIISHPNKK